MKKCPQCGARHNDTDTGCECSYEFPPMPDAGTIGLIDSPAHKIIVTTGDLKQDYEIIGPVYFQMSNKGVFSSHFSNLSKQYEAMLSELKTKGQVGETRFDDVGAFLLFGELSVRQSDFDKAFFIAVQELKKRAAFIGADAIISMRQNMELDTTGSNFSIFRCMGPLCG